MDKKTKEIVDFAKTGQIDPKTGWLKFPVLYSMDKHKKFRYWQVIVGIALNQPIADRSDTDGAWISKVKFEPVTQEYIERGELPKKAEGVYWTRSGQEGGAEKITKPTYIDKGTNTGRKNYTTSFTQSIRKCMTAFNSRVKKGSVPDKSVLKPRDEVHTFEELMGLTHRGDTPWRVFPMALHNVDDTKSDNWARIKYPLFVQPKYDGTRFIVVSHPLLPTIEINGTKYHIDSYSRGREHYPQEHILAELASTMAKYPGLHLDGELWKEGHSLQDISGSSRREKDSKREDAVQLNFNVYDAFYVDKPKMPFEERNAIIDDFFDDLEGNRTTSYVTRVSTVEVDNKTEFDETYQQYLDKGYEGAVARMADSPYEVGINKEERSYQTLKRKPRDDAEWPIVGFADGKRGKEKGAIIFECARRDNDKNKDKPLSDRKKFTVTPNWTYKKRYNTYEFFSNNSDIFMNEFYGKEAVIEYATLSKDDIPQQLKFIRFRDPKLDEKLNTYLS